MDRVNVLGSSYVIHYRKECEDVRLKGLDGYIDYTAHEIVIRRQERGEDSCKDPAVVERDTLRHELIHAFLHESGLNSSSLGVEAWASNEEMVDWLALQMPKIVEVMEEAGAL